MSFLEPAFVYFLLLFFPVYFLLNATRPASADPFVALASFLFAAWYYPPFAAIIVLQMLVIHGAHARRLGLPLAVTLVLLPLLVFKYSAFIASGFGVALPPLPLPLGISFYSFTAVAVLVEMYRSHDVDAAYGPTSSLKILTFWPHLASGPILRPKHLWQPYVPTRDRDLKLALVLVIFGLFKKVVVADGAGTVAGRALELGTANLSLLDVAYAAVAMSIQIYGDFSGYSDMALGFAILIGVRLPANFNYPYLADSMRDFWRRWHISLTTWFRDYVYVPLGGSRRGPLRTYGHVLIVFLISGLWHGAAMNFLLWGLLHGVLLVIENVTSFRSLPSAVRRTVVLPVIVASWLVFFLDTESLLALLDPALLGRAANPDAFGPSVLLFAGLVLIEHLLPPYRVDHEGFPTVTRLGVLATPVVLVATTLFWSEPLPFIYFAF